MHAKFISFSSTAQVLPALYGGKTASQRITRQAVNHYNHSI
jgi:hypothetical protein